MGPIAHLELKPEVVLAEELGEHLAAEGADREDLVLLRVVLEEDRGERLRRGARDHARAGRRIIDAAIGAAGDDLSLAGGRTRLLPGADEGPLSRRGRDLVRADRGRRGDPLVRR